MKSLDRIAPHPLLTSSLLCTALLCTAFGCDGGERRTTPDATPITDAAVDAARPDFGADPPLTEAMTAAIDAFDGEAAVYVRNLVTGEGLTRRARERHAAGGLSALLVAIAYVDRVDAGDATPDDGRLLRPDDLRGGGISNVGATYTYADLVTRALAGDRTAEQVLADGLGGPDTINQTVVQLGLDGIGRYQDPCERDRAYADGLDPRFADADCAALAAWIHRDDPSGLVPQPFAEAPTFDAPTRAAAAAARLAAGPGTVTARGWARLLARLDDNALLGPALDSEVIALLDDGRATGGGDDALPASIWSGSLEGTAIDGRHWIGRVRAPDAPPLAMVFLTAETQAPVAALTRRLATDAWTTLIGAPGPWPPPDREAEAQVALLTAADADTCDTGGLADRGACLLDNGTGTFAPDDRITAVTLVAAPDGVEIATTFTAPDGTRDRLQKRLAPSGWWWWAEDRTVEVEGEWFVTVAVDGVPVRTIRFAVDERFRRE